MLFKGSRQADLLNLAWAQAGQNKPNIDELSKWVTLLRQGLHLLISNDVDKSYNGVCSTLQSSLDNLRGVVFKSSVVPKSDDLVHLSFSAILTLNSVFCSMNRNQKDRNRDMLSRLLVHVTSQKPPLFPPEQMKKIEAMIPSLDSHVVSSITIDGDGFASPAQNANEIFGGQGLVCASSVVLMTSRSNSLLRASAEIEDPRQKSVVDGPIPKRPRLTDSEVFRDVQAASETGGCLEDSVTGGLQVGIQNNVVENTGNDPWKLENAAISCGANGSTVDENKQLQVPSSNSTSLLPSLLKDIAANPATRMNLRKREQLKSVNPAKGTTQSPRSNVVRPKSLVPCQRSARIQNPQSFDELWEKFQDELGIIHMKPRDPRRVLGSNKLFQKGGSSGSDQPPKNMPSAQGKGNLNSQKQDQSVKKWVSSHSVKKRDIAPQHTKKLKSIADIMSASQSSRTLPGDPEIPSSHVQICPSLVDIKGVPHLQSGTDLASEEVTADPQHTWEVVEHLFEGFDDQRKAAIQRERARRIGEQKSMFAARKLCLVLDLDHTLLNSAKFSEIDPVHEKLLRKKEERDCKKSQRHLFRFPHMEMWTKLRPGVWNFFEKASKLYELHLYTMGNKRYATEMAKVLDPKGVLFGKRVIAKGDDGDLMDSDENVPKTKNLEGVLGMESAVVIIDDSVRAWPDNKLNLIVVERYIYFPCTRRQFGLPGPSLLDIDRDERPNDGTLASSLAVIERIHENFFSHVSLNETDVRNILASEQRKILAGCRIVFSRVIPIGEVNPHSYPLWKTAEQFGATCTSQIDDQVTHVVAMSLGTDKVKWALSTRRFVVHPGWVEASALLYRRANERDFTIKIR